MAVHAERDKHVRHDDRREALQALLNHDEDELAVLRYKGEVRKMRWAGGQGQRVGGAVL